jgi:hypothetical protein
MNRDGHDIVSLLFLASIFLLSLINFIGGSVSQFIFLLSYILFSTKLSPDIDMKLPFVGHRGPTHRHTGILIVSVIIAAIFIFVFPYIGIKVSDNIMWASIFGFIVAWLLHSITDAIYDRFGNWSWIIVSILPIGTYIYLESKI